MSAQTCCCVAVRARDCAHDRDRNQAIEAGEWPIELMRRECECACHKKFDHSPYDDEGGDL